MLTKFQKRFLKLISIITLYNSWVIFEETVIDRQGLWKYLPDYEYGCFCIWDIGAIIIFSLLVWLLFREKKEK